MIFMASHPGDFADQRCRFAKVPDEAGQRASRRKSPKTKARRLRGNTGPYFATKAVT
jgi:hypothetical protein